MNMPVQGDFEYSPLFVFLEDATMVGLQAQLSAEVTNQAEDVTDYFMVEQIQYQVSVIKPAVGMNDQVMSYSCMIWGSHARRI